MNAFRSAIYDLIVKFSGALLAVSYNLLNKEANAEEANAMPTSYAARLLLSGGVTSCS